MHSPECLQRSLSAHEPGKRHTRHRKPRVAFPQTPKDGNSNASGRGARGFPTCWSDLGTGPQGLNANTVNQHCAWHASPAAPQRPRRRQPPLHLPPVATHVFTPRPRLRAPAGAHTPWVVRGQGQPGLCQQARPPSWTPILAPREDGRGGGMLCSPLCTLVLCLYNGYSRQQGIAAARGS